MKISTPKNSKTCATRSRGSLCSARYSGQKERNVGNVFSSAAGPRTGMQSASQDEASNSATETQTTSIEGPPWLAPTTHQVAAEANKDFPEARPTSSAHTM